MYREWHLSIHRLNVRIACARCERRFERGTDRLSWLHVCGLHSGGCVQPVDEEQEFPERIFPRQPQSRRVGACSDVRRHECIWRQLHWVPVKDLHARLDSRPVDRQLHRRADLCDGATWKTHQSGRTNVGSDHRPRRAARSLWECEVWPAGCVADRVLHGVQLGCPVQSGQRNP